MATRRLSPTASLLKSSRLFSLPPPLPRPGQQLTYGPISESDTATLPYPTHAAIETTQSSLSRGDWGLKRPLPLKSTTNTSTPTIRIDDVDSIDHITEFESAADHTLTLQKWHEIGLPISMPVVTKGAFVSNADLDTRRTAPTSVFEKAYDNTEKHGSRLNAQRWKFKGPWLAGKTEGEFGQYLEKNVKSRKQEFRKFLRHRLERKIIVTRRRTAQESGENFESQVEVSEGDVDRYLKQIRRDEVRLQTLIEEFLDLPMAADSNPEEGSFVAMIDSDKGPPSTHLSAGLSYLRTASHMTNHPVLGPMAEEPPIQARILRPQRMGFVRHQNALLGVGGIAAEDSTKRTAHRDYDDREVRGIQTFEPDIEGGAKIWIRPDRASIDVHGRPKVHNLRVEPWETEVYEGVIRDTDVESSTPSYKKYPLYRPKDQTMPKLDTMRNPTPRRDSFYGLGRDNSSQSPSRVKPLDVPQGSENTMENILKLVP